MMTGRLSQALIALGFCGLAGAAWFAAKTPLVALALGLLPFGALFVLRMPVIVIIGFVVFSLFRIHEAYPQLYSLRIPQLLALAAFATIGYQLLTRRLVPFLTFELKLALAFFALVSFDVVFASNVGLAMGFWTGTYVKIAVMVFAIAWLVRRPQDLALTARLFAVAGFLVAIVAIQNRLNGIGLVEGTRVTIGRDFGSMLGDPNDLALVLLFPTSFAAAMVLRRGLGPVDRIIGLVVLVALIFGVLYTQSRGGLLGLIGVAGVYAWNRTRNKALLIVAGGAVGAVLFMLAGVGDRSVVAAADGVDESSMGRLYAWEAAFYMALSNPLTGVGLDNFYANYFFYSNHWDGKNHAVHSTWFGVLAEAGFLGFFVFVAFVWATVRLSMRSVAAAERLPIRTDRSAAWIGAVREALLAGLAGFVISGTFLTMGFIWPVYILHALIVAADRILPDGAEDRQSQDG
ncbi:MAG: O-antigen ligase family protein [Thalassobaculaceae bacterium]